MSIPPPRPQTWVFDAHHDPPSYTRPMVGSELTLQRYWNTYDGDGEACVAINFTSPLGIEELKARACEALDKLRFICPLVACTVEDVISPRWVYIPSADRKEWLDLAFTVEERGASLNPSQFIQTLNLRRLPYSNGKGMNTFFRVYLLTTSKEGDEQCKEYGLYFHATHTILDAGPALHGLNMMCEWISGEGMDVTIEPSEEWRNLPADPITATGGPSNEWETAGMALLQECLQQHTQLALCHTVAPPSRQVNRSDPPIRLSASLTELETAAIIAKTKKLGVSVSALFFAVNCLAQLKMNPVPEGITDVDFSCPLTVSLERYLKPPVTPRTHLVSSTTLMPSRISLEGPLKEPTEKGRLILVANLIQELFDKHLDNPCLPHLLAVVADMMPVNLGEDDNTKPSGHAKAKEPPLPPWKCSFQNLGAIEKKLRIKHRELTVESMCTGSRFQTCLRVHLWTMNSQFHIQVQGSTAWGEECVKNMLEETRRIGLIILDEN